MKKVLIITYYWPPSGGAGVQRWLKFTKYLREFGWEPLIYTPYNPEIPDTDNSLLKDIPGNLTVLKQPIWEPYNIYKIFTFKKKQRINVNFLSETKKHKLSEKLSVWIRSNFFIPDARCFWIKPSVKFLEKYIAENHLDAIISTGPPHSMHLIALNLVNKLKSQNSKFKIPKWLADFRDPWTLIDFYSDLKLTSWADKKQHKLEFNVLEYADAVVCVGKNMSDEFNSIFKRNYTVITNGFDYDDYPLYDPRQTNNLQLTTKFSIAHIGSMFKSKKPYILWEVLNDLILKDKDFAAVLEIKLIGKLDISIKEEIKRNNLEKYVNIMEYLPHNEIVKIQKQSQLLLLVIKQTAKAKGILTGKLFEYLAAKRPIIFIGPMVGDAADIINETKAGKVIEYDDRPGLKEAILNYYNLFKQGKLISESVNIDKYSRRELTSELAKILDNIVSP